MKKLLVYFGAFFASVLIFLGLFGVVSMSRYPKKLAISQGDYLLFNGKKLVLQNKDHVAKYLWKADAGRPFTSGKDQQLKNKGPLPEGKYIVDVVQMTSIKNVLGPIDLLKWVVRSPAWGLINTPLIPDKNNQMYGRDAFYIHGGGWFLGSKGCIYLGLNNYAVHRLLTVKEPFELIVKY